MSTPNLWSPSLLTSRQDVRESYCAFAGATMDGFSSLVEPCPRTSQIRQTFGGRGDVRRRKETMMELPAWQLDRIHMVLFQLQVDPNHPNLPTPPDDPPKQLHQKHTKQAQHQKPRRCTHCACGACRCQCLERWTFGLDAGGVRLLH